MKLLMTALALVALTACAGVVRDEHVYKQEMAFVGQVTATLAEQQLGQAEAAGQVGDELRCQALAEVALVASIRVPWHLAKARSLAELDDDPGAPPEVPTARAWCAERSAVIR